MKTHKPTLAISNNMQRGIALNTKYSTRESASHLGTINHVQKAKDIIEEGFTLDNIKELYSKLSQLEKSVDFRRRLSDGGPSEEVIKFYAYGGSSALAWARTILKQGQILKSHKKDITEAEMNKDGDDAIYGKIQVAKSLNEELMQVTYVAMLPNSTDLHGDFTSVEEVRKAKESFNKSAQNANLFHLAMTDTFSVIESYLAPTDMILNSILVEKGTWLMTLQVLDEGLWALIKSGEINGISIGALANAEKLND